VAIARALLANPAVLVLDEPTSALDPETERVVAEGFETFMRGRTTIVITHRRELASRAERVVVLDGARLAEPTRIFV
jgi:ATP-binding cassette subfamily B protein